MAKHLQLHSFTGTTDHDFTGLAANQFLTFDGTNIVSSNTSSFGNTYFVAPDGNDSTGTRGDLLKPFQTISGARDVANDELTGGTITGDTLIYVFPGEYVDEEMQYDNGNFYFSPGATVRSTPRTNAGQTAMFTIGSTPIYSSPSANTCNVFGQATFILQESTDADWGGTIISVANSGSCYFECDTAYVEQGVGVGATSYGTLTFKGNFLGVETSGYVATVRDYSDTVFDFRRIYNNGVGWPFFIRQGAYPGFYGRCIVNADKITAQGSGYPAIAIQQMRPGGEVIFNVPRIESTSSYAFQQLQASGGKTTINGNLYGLQGATLSQNSGVYVQLNGNIEVDSTAVNMASNNNETHTFYVNGDIINETGITNSVVLSRGKFRLNGMIQNQDPDGTGTTYNGISITGAGELVIDNAKIITDNESITAGAARDIRVIHSLAANKALNANITNIINGSNIIIDSEID
jgi:hypothetical protein